jgi:hypothetical protein
MSKYFRVVYFIAAIMLSALVSFFDDHIRTFFIMLNMFGIVYLIMIAEDFIAQFEEIKWKLK